MAWNLGVLGKEDTEDCTKVCGTILVDGLRNGREANLAQDHTDKCWNPAFRRSDTFDSQPNIILAEYVRRRS